MQDLRYSLRLLYLNPVFTFVAIASLALGTGANTAIFQLLDTIRLRTLPVQAPQQLVEFRIDDTTHARGNWLRPSALTNPLWEEIRKHNKPFSGMFAWATDDVDLATQGESHQATALWVSGDFFRVLGIQPALGHLFTARDDQRGCALTPGAVLSYRFWQRQFGADPNIIGRQVWLGQHHLQVSGVTPPSFFGLEVGRSFDIALPICSATAWYGNSDRVDSGITWWLTVMARLRPGTTLEQAAAMMRAQSAGIFNATLPAGYPSDSVKPYLAMKLLTTPAGHGLSALRDQYSRPLTLLLAIAGLVLLVACFNLANLMLVRATARQREMAVRLAIGASRARLAWQLFLDGLLISIAGSIAGLVLAQALIRFLLGFLTTPINQLFVDLSLDVRVFAFTAGTAVLTCLIFSIVPALEAARTDPGEALKTGGRNASSGRSQIALRRSLVISQIAVSLVLLIASLLFVRSLRNLLNLDPGFQPRGMVLADLDFSPLKLSPARRLSLHRDVLEHIRAIPSVQAASEATVVPLTGGDWNNRAWRDGSDLSHAFDSLRTMIGTQYFRTMGTPRVAGRELNEHDFSSAAKVALVNEEFARELTGSPNAIGKYFWVEPTPYEPQTSYEIVGVVKNTKYRDLREQSQPIMYMPMWPRVLQSSQDRLLIRYRGDFASATAGLRNTLRTISPEIRYSCTPYDNWIEDSLVRERLMAALSGIFGVLAILLSAVGIYGVISYTVASRTTEIGIRMALGAEPRSVIRLLLQETSGLLVAGAVIGTLLAFFAGRTAASLIFGVSSYDPLTYLTAVISLCVVGVAAGYIPAWRGSKVTPIVALRRE